MANNFILESMKVKKQLLLAIMALIYGSTIFCMDTIVYLQNLPAEGYKEMMPSLDIFSARALFMTCKQNYTMYGEKICPIKSYLHEDQRRCSALSVNTYMAALTHYSQKKDALMVRYLIDNDSEAQKKERLDMYVFCGLNIPSDDVEQQVKYTLLICQGKMRQDIVEDYIKRAIDENKRQILKIFIKNNIKLNALFDASTRGRSTYFSWAASNNDIEVLKLLKKVGANPNIKGRKNNTLLHLVVQRPNLCGIAQLLIDCGADVNCENDLKCKPFDYAQSDEMKKLLLENGANVAWYQKLGCLFL